MYLCLLIHIISMYLYRDTYHIYINTSHIYRYIVFPQFSPAAFFTGSVSNGGGRASKSRLVDTKLQWSHCRIGSDGCGGRTADGWSPTKNGRFSYRGDHEVCHQGGVWSFPSISYFRGFQPNFFFGGVRAGIHFRIHQTWCKFLLGNF